MHNTLADCTATVLGVAYSAVTSTSYDVGGNSNASTPMIVSNVVGGDQIRDMFTISTISDGRNANTDIKVAVENVNTTTNTFDIVVRDFSDEDASPVYLEKFSKCKMDPTSSSYILKKIGDDQHGEGLFTLNSKYIYITVEAGDFTGLVPGGFKTVYTPTQGSIGYPYFPIKTGYTESDTVSKKYLGVQYDDIDLDLVMGNFGSEWDMTDSTNGTAVLGFHFEAEADTVTYVISDGISTATTENKFVLPLLGGLDGWLRTDISRSMSELEAVAGTDLYVAWTNAIDQVSNPEEFDLNLFAVPGVPMGSAISSYALEMVEARADAFYVMDIGDSDESATAAASAAATVDSNYAAVYYPHVRIYDSDNSQYVTIPPTPQVLEAMAYTDSISYPWFAPAGMNRGLMTDVVSAADKLTIADRNICYEGKVNPIATFPGQGITIWGQKTLQTRSTSLDRINVRRMMLYARKEIAGATKYLVFEANDSKTWDQFKGMVNPVLDRIKIKRGLYDFRVVMDATTNTPDVIDRNHMVGQIYLKPTKTAEMIVINFNIMPTGATFED